MGSVPSCAASMSLVILTSLVLRLAATAWGIALFLRTRDRWVALITLSWPFAWTIVFVVGTVWALVFGIPETAWATWWRWWTWGILVAGAAVVAWFTIGGTRDLVRMYRLLARRGPDERDDGTVGDGAGT